MLALLLLSSSLARAAEGEGDLTIAAFDDAGLATVDVELDGARHRTPTVVHLAAGEHRLVVDGRTVLVAVNAGGVTDVVLHLQADRSADDRIVVDATGAAEQHAAPVSAATHAVTVQVRSALDDTPIENADVVVRGAGRMGRTNAQGVLEMQVADLGDTDVAVVAAGFLPRTSPLPLSDVEAVAVTVLLLPEADELSTLTVRAPHVRGGMAVSVAQRRASKQVVEVVSAEQMRKSGDSDAASALRRVTGLTIVDGKYVYVRGLGDRYSSTLVNQAVIPSPEPERRVVPLDLFPSALLDSLQVQKTWSADLPGEFGGGSVQLRTRSQPEQRVLSVSVSTSFVPGTTFASHLMGPAGSLDALAADDGTRAVAPSIVAASADAPLAAGNALTGGGLSQQELETLGEDVGPGWTPSSQLALPGGTLQVAAGDVFTVPWGTLGVLGGLTWSTETRHTDMSRQLTASGADGVVVTDDLDIDTTVRSTTLGGVLSLGTAFGTRHQLRAVTMLNRSADDDTRLVSGYDQDIDGQFRLTRLRYVSRQLFLQQVLGEHALTFAPFAVPKTTPKDPVDDTDDSSAGEAKILWRAGYALALRDEPGQRLTRYDQDDDGVYRLSDRSDGNQLLSSSLVDHAVDSAVTFRLPLFALLPSAVAEAGTALSLKLRDVKTRRYKFLFTGDAATDNDVLANDADDIFVDKHIGADGFTIAEATRNTDNHTGSSTIGAGFVTLDTPVLAGFVDDVHLNAGVRVEGSRLEVTTYELFNASAAPVVAQLDGLDVLPALSVRWEMLDDVKLTVAGSRTVVRPELRELSPAVYTDVAGGRARFGNPDLQTTSIVHLDVRTDWAWSVRDGVSLAGFAKLFDKPIESVVTAGADQAITAANVDGATSLGVEVEGRCGLDTALRALSIDAPTVPVLSGLFVGANGALIWSQVQIGEEQQGTLTSTTRALEGQSPWMVNLQLGTDDDLTGLSILALYNVIGPRIVEVGALGLPDAIEQPFHRVDVVIKQRLPLGFSLSLQGKNLLDPAAEKTLGERTVESVQRGRTFSIGLSWAL
jgi:hypothetical protein